MLDCKELWHYASALLSMQNTKHKRQKRNAETIGQQPQLRRIFALCLSSWPLNTKLNAKTTGQHLELYKVIAICLSMQPLNKKLKICMKDKTEMQKQLGNTFEREKDKRQCSSCAELLRYASH